MDVIPMCSIFQELQIVHDTGYFSALPSLEEYWQQVFIFVNSPIFTEKHSKMNDIFFPHIAVNLCATAGCCQWRCKLSGMQNNKKFYYLDL